MDCCDDQHILLSVFDVRRVHNMSPSTVTLHLCLFPSKCSKWAKRCVGKKTLLCFSSHSYFGFRNNLSWLGEQVGLPAWQRFPPSFPRDAKLPVQSPNHNFPGNVNYSNGYLLYDYTTSSANRGTVWLLKGLIRWTLNIWNFKLPTFPCATLNSRSKGSASTWKI